MKRTLKGVLAASMVLGVAVPTAFARTATLPTDLGQNQYSTAIDTMVNMGVLNLYSDNTFRPTLDVSRGQFIAYVYNILNANGVIQKHYTEKAQPYNDENADFRNQINDMYLYGYLNNLDLGNGAIGQNYKTPKWWAAQLLCNVAGISYDSSNPWDALNKARAAGFIDNTGDKVKLTDKDANGSLYYLSRGEMAQILENFYLNQFPDKFNGVVTAVTAKVANDTVSSNTADQISVAATDVKGNAVDLSSGHTVTYAVTSDNASDAVVYNNGKFFADAPGKYTVVATVDGVAADPVTINVYDNNVSALTVSADKDLVADANTTTGTYSSATVTVKAVDSKGNVVQNFNGPVTLTSSNSTDASVGSTTATASQTVNAVNGVATFTVYNLGGAAGDAPVLTAQLANSSSVTGTMTEKVDAPVASSFSIGYTTGQPNGLAVNNYTAQTAVTVTALDQAGNTMAADNQWATVSISGPASFLGNSATSQNVWIGAGVSNPVYVVGKQGVTGNVVVTVSAPGMTSQSFTIPAYVQTAATALVASASSNTVGSGGTTTITVKEVDANGNLAVLNSAGQPNSDTITLSQDSGSSNVQLYDAANNSPITQVTLQGGQATFTVRNAGYIGTGNIKLSNAGGLLTSTVPLTFTVGSATQIAPLQTVVNAPQGSTQALTFQMEDAAGNAIKTAGVPVTFTTTSGTLSASSGTTDANGQVKVSVTLGGSGTSAVVAPAATGYTGVSETLNAKSAYDLATSVTGMVYDNGSGKLQQAGNLSIPAGDTVYMDVYGEDAVGIAVGANDSYSVTSSNANIVSVNGSGNGSATLTQGAANGDPNGTIVKSPTSNPNAVVALQGHLAGTAAITVTDTSVVGNPSYTFNVTVSSLPTPGSLTVSGLANGATVVPGQTYALNINLADAGGNPVFLGQADTMGLPVSLTDSTGTVGDFRATGNGYSITSATIPQYGNSVVVYWTAPNVAAGTQINLNFNALYGANKTPLSGSITGLVVQ